MGAFFVGLSRVAPREIFTRLSSLTQYFSALGTRAFLFVRKGERGEESGETATHPLTPSQEGEYGTKVVLSTL